MKEWWNTKAWPKIRSFTVAHAIEWWNDIGDHPKTHFISMVVGMALLGAVKFAVRLVV